MCLHPRRPRRCSAISSASGRSRRAVGGDAPAVQQLGALRRGGEPPGEHEQGGRLAGAQVVAGRLAGDRRVAVDPEQVVAELERLADRQAVAGVRASTGGASACRAGQGAPKSSGRCDRVARPSCSRATSSARSTDQAAGLGLAEHVEVLPGDRLDPHPVVAARAPRTASAAAPRARASSWSAQTRQRSPTRIADGGAEPVRVADAGRRRVLAGERSVRGGPAAPGGGVVHHVVVDQRERVQQLERGERRQHRLDGRVPARRPRASPSRRTSGAAACRRPARDRVRCAAKRPSAGSSRSRAATSAAGSRRGCPRPLSISVGREDGLTRRTARRRGFPQSVSLATRAERTLGCELRRLVRRFHRMEGRWTTDLAAAYERCRELHRRHGRTYYLATRLLPGVEAPARARALRLHPVRRRDRRPHRGPAAGRARGPAGPTGPTGSSPACTASRSTTRCCPAVLHTIAVFDLDRDDFASFLRSMAMDLTVTSYADLRRPARLHGGLGGGDRHDDAADPGQRRPGRGPGAGPPARPRLPAHQLHPGRRRGPRPRPHLPAGRATWRGSASPATTCATARGRTVHASRSGT